MDDQEAVAKALATVIRRAGFDAFPCHSGAEAIAFADTERPPRAAVVDIHLPDISGLDLAKKLRTRFGADTPIIMVSGDTSIETLKSLPHVGATYFFPKPLNSAALIERLKELTQES